MGDGRIRNDLPDGALMENGMKNQTTSAGRFYGRSTIYGKDAEHDTPYMTRYWFGRLRLHIFYRGDQDPDPHDHPWGFWTFPLTSYVEEVVTPLLSLGVQAFGSGEYEDQECLRRQVVPAWRWSHRPATHCHRVLGRYDPKFKHPPFRAGLAPFYPGDGTVSAGPAFKTGKIITLVWRGHDERKWGFLKNRDGRWCWVHWKEYVFGTGKSAPCE